MKKNNKEKIEEMTQKRQKVQTKENLDNLGMEKVDNFIVQEIFSTIDECRLKVYDQIGDICYLEYNEAFKKGIELH